MRLIKAFTMVEFLTVLAIAAIIISLIVPGYYKMVQNNKIITATNELSASMSFARMEAIKRGVRVAVCPSADATYTACGTQWAQGWLVFVDENNNNLVDATSNLMKITQAQDVGTTITSTAAIISYDSTGFVPTGTATLTVRSDGCTGTNARILTVNNSGRISISPLACP